MDSSRCRSHAAATRSGLLTRSFNEMVAQLRHAPRPRGRTERLERFTALGQLAGALAHEIKNPLNFISLALDQMRMRYGPQLPRDATTSCISS